MIDRLDMFLLQELLAFDLIQRNDYGDDDDER